MERKELKTVSLNSSARSISSTTPSPSISSITSSSNALIGAYYSAERNGTEHLIPQNTYFAEHIEMGPKQLPSLVVIT